MSTAMKLGKETGSFFNHLMSASREVPNVDKGATVIHWTDRSAYFVNWVSEDGKECIIERAKAVREDRLGMSDAQSYRYERYKDGDGDLRRSTLRFRYGRWYIKHGTPLTGISYSRINIAFGFMREYHDYSF